jgi:phage-related protein
MNWHIIFYEDGPKQPVKEYLDGLQPKAAAKILRNLLLLSEFGLELGFPYVSNIERNLWELRIVAFGDTYRMLFSLLPGRTFLILHGFQKKTDKLPDSERDIALKRLARYLEQNRKEKN